MDSPNPGGRVVPQLTVVRHINAGWERHHEYHHNRYRSGQEFLQSAWRRQSRQASSPQGAESHQTAGINDTTATLSGWH